MAKLELSLDDETKELIENLTGLVVRLEKVASVMSLSAPGAKAAHKKVKDEEETELDEDVSDDVNDDEDEDFAPKKSKKLSAKNGKGFDDEDEEASEESDDEVEEEDEEPSSKKKAKKLTVDDVNDACKARAAKVGGKEGRTEVLNILKKKFKTTSVSELKPDSYAAAIAAMRS